MYDVMRMNIKWFHAQVVFEGKDLVDANEDQPYAARPLDFYTRTKVAARCFCRPTAQAAFQKPSCTVWLGLTVGCRHDKLTPSATECQRCPQVLGETVVLSANGQGNLATIALRPSGIFGEGDPLFVPVVVDKAVAGKMKYIIGNGRNVMDFTYVGNVAQAHLEVLASLSPPQPAWNMLLSSAAHLKAQIPADVEPALHARAALVCEISSSCQRAADTAYATPLPVVLSAMGTMVPQSQVAALPQKL